MTIISVQKPKNVELTEIILTDLLFGVKLIFKPLGVIKK